MNTLWQHFSKRTLALILVLIVITGGLLYIAIREDQPAPKMAAVATPTPSPAHATLMLSPEETNSSAFQVVDIIANSNTNKLTGAQINLSYNPKVLSGVIIKPGTYFTNPNILLSTVDRVSGRITLVLAIGQNSSQATGSGTIATISYTILPTAGSTTELTFLPKTEVTQEGILGSVLKSTTNLTISIPEALQISTTTNPSVPPASPVKQ